MTTVTYNGIKLTNVLTRNFSQTREYDSTGVGGILNRFSMKFVCWMHSEQGTGLGITSATEGVMSNATDAIVAFRRKLLSERGQLTVTVGGHVLLAAGPATSNAPGLAPGVDVDNGPKPRRVDITHIAGTRCYRVEFDIDAALVECDSSTNALGVLSNRWWVSDSIDDHWLTTRTMSGILRVANSQANPQMFRNLCIPPLQPGFQRLSIETTTSQDGLTLSYTVVDRERFAAPPFPAIDWNGVLSVFTDDGVNTRGSLRLSLIGDKNGDKSDLLAIGMKLLDQKLQINQKATTLVSANISDYLHENRLDIQADVLFAFGNSDTAIATAMVNAETIGLTKLLREEDFPGYHRDSWRVPGNYGTATTTGLFVCYLQRPCNSAHAMPNASDALTPVDGESGSSGPSGNPPTVTTYTGEPDTVTTSNYDDSHKEHKYTHYQIDAIYLIDQHKVQLPIAFRRQVEEGIVTASQPTAAFVKLAHGTAKRRIRVAAERLGDWPAIPNPVEKRTVGEVAFHLLDHSINVKGPKLDVDGKTRLYSIDAEYLYGCDRVPKPGSEEMGAGSLPWDTGKPEDMYLPTEALKDDIIK